jgi:hypothetical protein
VSQLASGPYLADDPGTGQSAQLPLDSGTTQLACSCQGGRAARFEGRVEPVDQDCGMSLTPDGGSGVPRRLRMLMTASRKVWSTSAGETKQPLCAPG